MKSSLHQTGTGENNHIKFLWDSKQRHDEIP